MPSRNDVCGVNPSRAAAFPMSAWEWRTSPGLASFLVARTGAFVISERTFATCATDVAVPEPTLNVSPATPLSPASSSASARSPMYRKRRRRGLARSVHVEDPQDDRLNAFERGDFLAGELAHHLRRRVRRGGGRLLRLDRRGVFDVSVDGGARGEHDAPRARVDGGFEDVQRALDVRPPVLLWLLHALRDGRLRGEMVDDLVVFDCRSEDLRLQDRRPLHANRLRDVLEVPQRSGREVVDDCDEVAAAQPFDDVGSDEPRAARHEDTPAIHQTRRTARTRNKRSGCGFASRELGRLPRPSSPRCAANPLEGQEAQDESQIGQYSPRWPEPSGRGHHDDRENKCEEDSRHFDPVEGDGHGMRFVGGTIRFAPEAHGTKHATR